MSNYKWEEPRGYYGDVVPVIEAWVDEETLAQVYVEYQDEVQCWIIVSGPDVHGTMGRHASTQYTQDWPEVERFIPREEWPEWIFGGRRGSGERTPDEAVAKAVDARAEYLIREYTRDESLYDDYYYTWETRPAPASNPLAGSCHAKLSDGGKLTVSIYRSHGKYHAYILRFDARGYILGSTERPEEWGAIEEVYPRAVWPKELDGAPTDDECDPFYRDNPPAFFVRRAANADMWLRVRDALLRPEGRNMDRLLESVRGEAKRFDTLCVNFD